MTRTDRGYAIWSQYQDKRDNQLFPIWESEMVSLIAKEILTFFPSDRSYANMHSF